MFATRVGLTRNSFTITSQVLQLFLTGLSFRNTFCSLMTFLCGAQYRQFDVYNCEIAIRHYCSQLEELKFGLRAWLVTSSKSLANDEWILHLIVCPNCHTGIIHVTDTCLLTDLYVSFLPNLCGMRAGVISSPSWVLDFVRQLVAL